MKGIFSVFLIGSIRFYQKALSPDHGWIRVLRSSQIQVCGYYPTCSEYAIAAIEKYGPYRGFVRALRRVFSCHPWQKKHVDLP